MSFTLCYIRLLYKKHVDKKRLSFEGKLEKTEFEIKFFIRLEVRYKQHPSLKCLYRLIFIKPENPIFRLTVALSGWLLENLRILRNILEASELDLPRF